MSSSPSSTPLAAKKSAVRGCGIAPARGPDVAEQQRADVVGLARELAVPIREVDGARLEQPQRRRHRGRGCAARRRAASRAVSSAAGTARPTSDSRARSHAADPVGRRSARSGRAKLHPTISSSPCAVSASAARRRSCWMVGQAPGGAVPGRQRRRQLLEAVEPRHLLDQVRFAGHVGAAERGGLDIEAVGGVGRWRTRAPGGSAGCARAGSRVPSRARRRARPGAGSSAARAQRRRRRSSRGPRGRRTARPSASSRPPAPPAPARAEAASRTASRPRCAARA